ncbi:MAG: thioredoxin family protein [Gammaproteobacteria bacterium]|nr:thioredoxin family protein [Gammaproteobacteria bacterium]
MTKQTHPAAKTPNVLMLLATGCSHCPAVLNSLTELLKSGEIARLEAINIHQQPEIAQQYNVRSVPWLKIGQIELSGSQSKSEILKAITQSTSTAGLTQHYDELLNNGQLQQVIEHIQNNPDNLSLLVEMIQDEQIKISVQIGIGAIMEEFAETAVLIELIPALTELTKHSLARVRNDACFYLSLTADQSVKDIIESLLNDQDSEVRETAKDCLEDLESTL